MHIFAEVELLLPRFELRWQSTGGVAIWNNNLASQDGVPRWRTKERSRWRTKMANHERPRWRPKMASQDGEPNERPKMASQAGEPRWRTKRASKMASQELACLKRATPPQRVLWRRSVARQWSVWIWCYLEIGVAFFPFGEIWLFRRKNEMRLLIFRFY